jgi:16S rRNA (cytidine1402-2'-O)-methyltransferase
MFTCTRRFRLLKIWSSDMIGKIFLVPNFLGEKSAEHFAPIVMTSIQHVKHYIVEHEKTARAFFKEMAHPIHQDDFIFSFLNKHTDRTEIESFLTPCFHGTDIGLLSDAGIPCVADPGFEIVKHAHNMGIPIKPLSGMNSIMLALMSSGFNGQSFRFHGYLPHDKAERKKVYSEMQRGISKNETQIFIETPYRNHQRIQDLKQHFPKHQEMCVAVDLYGPTEEILRLPLSAWDSSGKKYHKRPGVFVLGK